MDEDQAWLEWQARSSQLYDQLNYSKPLMSAVMRSSHRLTERHFGPQAHFGDVLEIGAGTGEHLAFVRHGFDQYVLTDRDEAVLGRAKNKLIGAHGEKLRFSIQNGERLDFPDSSFHRLIAAHVLEHIYQPHLALKEWRRLVKPGGVISVLIPTDPGLAWRLGRHFGPRKNAVADGIAYDYVMAREHVNSCTNLIALLRHYFPDRVERWWPFPLPLVDLNLFFAFHAFVCKVEE